MLDGAALKIVRVAMEVLSMRLLTILAMGMSFLLACWAMWEPTWERMATAGFFAVCIYLPCIRWERTNDESNNEKN
jgi:hypothetical protein